MKTHCGIPKTQIGQQREGGTVDVRRESETIVRGYKRSNFVDSDIGRTGEEGSFCSKGTVRAVHENLFTKEPRVIFNGG